MSANPLKRLLRYLQRTPEKPVAERTPFVASDEDMSPAQRSSARAARKNPWLLAG